MDTGLVIYVAVIISVSISVLATAFAIGQPLLKRIRELEKRAGIDS